MSVRLRRMQADYEKLCTLFTQNSRIRIKKTLGTPPDKYQLEYLIGGLEKTLEGQLRSRNSFLVEITLTAAYPRLPPQCKMLTPVFHPNIAPHAICIGDHWAAGEALANLVIRIGEMLAYQSYNLKSPLNGEAAKWVESNKERLPLDTFDFTSLLTIGEAVGRRADGALQAGTVCANCGKTGAAETMHVCANMHTACDECLMKCSVCGDTLCLKCAQFTCAICKETVCARCSRKCNSCQRCVCAKHSVVCAVCGHPHCADCSVECARCKGMACLEHLRKIKRPDGRTDYLCENCGKQEPSL